MVLVFVYGTLKTGLPNHYLMKDSNNGKATFLAAGKTVKPFPLVVATPCNIPFILNHPGFGEIIEGEVYEVDDKMLVVLDALERNKERIAFQLLKRKPLFRLVLQFFFAPVLSTYDLRLGGLTDVAHSLPQLVGLYDRTKIEIQMLDSNQGIQQCEAYLINDFNEKLMELPKLKSYVDSSTYVSLRDQKRALKEVVSFVKKSSH